MNTVITGATKGIGRAIAERLLATGHNIFFCARSQGDIDSTVASWTQMYPEAIIRGYVCDMGEKEQIESFADEVISVVPSIDVLINNAGLFIPGEIMHEEAGLLEKMISVNLYSAYQLTRMIAPSMVERKSGHIFNMCSIASKIAYPNGGSYSISKFALLGFSKVLREEMKPQGIKVTSILPGATWSSSWSGVDLPEDRLMQANDVALAVEAAIKMSPSAVMEEIILRPQLGDL